MGRMPLDILMLAKARDRMLNAAHDEKCQHDDYKRKRNEKNKPRLAELAEKRRNYIKNNAAHVAKIRAEYYQKNKDILNDERKREYNKAYRAAKRAKNGRLSTDRIQ